MIKIFISVRNRLAITKKCIEALRRNSTIPHEIYVYNNGTSYRLKEHFEYFQDMFEKGVVDQVCFTTPTTTFNAFSKATAWNMFGLQHEQDPNKSRCAFILLIDNDIIMTAAWDKKLSKAWKYVRDNKLNYIKVIGQRPGGIKSITERYQIDDDLKAVVGSLGGSGLWSVRPNFFRDVGYLDLKRLVGQDKQHDQMYWRLLQEKSGGKSYIMGLQSKLGVHCGNIAGSVCNRLAKNRGKPDEHKNKIIQFAKQEDDIESLPFDEFYKKIINDEQLLKDW